MILQQAAKGRVGRDSGRGEARRALLVEGGLPPKQLRLNQRRFADTKCSRIVLADLELITLGHRNLRGGRCLDCANRGGYLQILADGGERAQ